MIYLLRTTCNWFDFDFNVIGTKGQQNLSNAISWIWICSYYRLYINPTLIFVLFCTNVLVFTTTAWIPCLNAVVSFVLYILLLLFHWCRLNFSVCLFFSCPVKLFFLSTPGSEGPVRISPRLATPLCRVVGHISEGEGIHYVEMRPQSGMFYF